MHLVMILHRINVYVQCIFDLLSMYLVKEMPLGRIVFKSRECTSTVVKTLTFLFCIKHNEINMRLSDT